MREQLCVPGFQLEDIVTASIALLRMHEPPEGYYGAFSGGKDSCVIKELAKLAGVKVTWHYHQTTIDPPELVRFIKAHHQDVVWDKPRFGNFFARILVNGFPTRVQRWCCKEYKEGTPPKGAIMILGVRAAESKARAKRWMTVTWHSRTRAWCVAPILHWSNDDVWQFIRERGLAYCSLYDEGFARIGCVGCPMAGSAGKAKQFARWPRFEALWKLAFKRLWEKRTAPDYKSRTGTWFGVARFANWEEMWRWWCSSDGVPALIDENHEDDSCQLALDMLSGSEGDE